MDTVVVLATSKLVHVLSNLPDESSVKATVKMMVISERLQRTILKPALIVAALVILPASVRLLDLSLEVQTTVHMRHGSQSPDSPAGSLRHCNHDAGSCTLRDGSALLWTPSPAER
ncbi:hypothetical protein COOONC_21299 [Cooperia oncophora]